MRLVDVLSVTQFSDQGEVRMGIIGNMYGWR